MPNTDQRMRETLIDYIYDEFKNRKINEGDFLEGLISRLPAPWLRKELKFLVHDMNPAFIHRGGWKNGAKVDNVRINEIYPAAQTAKKKDHPWKKFGAFKFGRRTSKRGN